MNERRTNRLVQAGAYITTLLIVTLGLVPTASAELVATGPQYTNADYTVTFSGCKDVPDTVYCRLEERVGSSSTWTSVGGAATGSVIFTNKPDGQYYYRAHEFIWSDEFEGAEPLSIVQHIYSDEILVTVTSLPIPVTDSIETQEQYIYQVKVGDLNGDNHQDIFVNRTLGGALGDGTLDNFFLMQDSSGKFSAIAGSANDHLVASLWATSAIEPVLMDVNFDGFVDIYLDDVDAHIANADPQLVFAPAQFFEQAPSGVLKYDTETVGFFEDLGVYYLDEDYFVDNAPPPVVVPGYWDHTVRCGWVYDYWDGSWRYVCEEDSVWVPGYSYIDYSGFDPDAIAIWQIIKDIIENGIGSWKDVIDILEDVVGVALGKDVCVKFGMDSDPDTCDGFRMHMLLARDQNARHKRAPGNIWITARQVKGAGPYHTALEYIDPTSGEISVYSGQQDNVILFNGTNELVGLENDPPDMPKNMYTAGAVTYLGISEAVANSTLFAMVTEYCNCLPYTAFPTSLPDGGYNSNSFTRGLIEASGGQPFYVAPNLPIDSPGWAKPVPSCYFTGECP